MGRRYEVAIALPGAFQASNVACALGLSVASGDDPERSVAVLGNIKGARGRLELAARHPSGAPIYVDYAHTPDALATVLKALRPHVRGRLLVVFGCGGDRDAGKRPIMGEIACALADAVIVTDDNPRSEDPATIRKAVRAGCPAAREIGDRAEAIRAAVAELEEGDVLLIAGKGHETGQIVGREVRPFDDVQAACAAVEKAA
jgi:UDP-N-acetylmuramoyl-L-alanyl-D-glutamate--2,6-diaminopimelate ligase